MYLWQGTHFKIVSENSQILAPNMSRTVLSAFLEDQWKINSKLKLVAGFRLDHYKGFGDNTETIINPRVSFVYKTGKITLKTLYASAVRPPSIYERTGINLAPLKGNSNLKSEKVQTAEFSLIYKSGGFKFQITPFLQIFTDKIEYIPGTGEDANSFVATNNGKTEVWGLDTELWYYFNKSNYIFVTASKFDSKDKKAAHRTYFLPDFYLNGGVNLSIKKFSFNLTAYYRNKRALPANLVINKKYASGSHFMANLNISYRFNKKFSVYTKIVNLTNKDNFVPLSVDGMFVPYRKITVHTGVKFNL